MRRLEPWPVAVLLALSSCESSATSTPQAEAAITFSCGRFVPHLALACHARRGSAPPADRTLRLDAEIVLVSGAPERTERIAEPCMLPAETLCPRFGPTLDAGYEAACLGVADEAPQTVARIILRAFGTHTCAPGIEGGSSSGASPEWQGNVAVPLGAPPHRATLRAAAFSSYVGCTLRVGGGPPVPFVAGQATVATAILAPGQKADLALDCVTPSRPGWVGLGCFGGCGDTALGEVPTAYDETMILEVEAVPCEGAC